MANIDNNSGAGLFPDVPLLDVETDALATPDGPMNAQAVALVARTSFLKDAQDAMAMGLGNAAGFQQAGAGSVLRPFDEKAREVLSVADKGASPLLSGAANNAAFALAFADAAASGKAVHIPSGVWTINGDLAWPARMPLIGEGALTQLNFVDGGLIASNVDYILGRDFVVTRTGTPGPAIKLDDGGTGFRRNYLDNVWVLGSTGNGVEVRSGWIFTWLNPIIRNCAGIGLLATVGGVAPTGINNLTLVGGEIQNNTVAGVVLDVCKQVNFVGTCIEGNGVGIGIGSAVSAVSIQGYFEGNSLGQIVPYSHNGGSAGIAASVSVQKGCSFTRGNNGPYDSPAINIPKCRNFIVDDCVRFSGYVNMVVPMIQVADVGDTNLAAGYVGEIYTDSPAALTLLNSCKSFGRREVYNFSPALALSATATSTVYRAPIPKLSVLSSPATGMDVYVAIDLPATAGDAVFTIRTKDATGAVIGSAVVLTQTLAVGFNQFHMRVADSDNVVAFEIFRSGASASDTAGDATLLGLTVERRVNRFKNI